MNSIKLYFLMGFPGGSNCEESACDEGDLGSILGWEDTLLLLFYVLVFGMLNLSSLARNPTRSP